MLENAVRICDATFGNIYRWDGEALHLLAAQNTPPAFAEARKRLPRHPSPNTPAGRTIATRTAVHVADLAAEQAYGEHHDPATGCRTRWRPDIYICTPAEGGRTN